MWTFADMSEVKKLTLSEINRGEWYDASAERPNKNLHVIVTNSAYDRFNPAWYEAAEDNFLDEIGFPIGITHWMLPKEV